MQDPFQGSRSRIPGAHIVQALEMTRGECFGPTRAKKSAQGLSSRAQDAPSIKADLSLKTLAPLQETLLRAPRAARDTTVQRGGYFFFRFFFLFSFSRLRRSLMASLFSDLAPAAEGRA
jgi:hypothetical protein